MSVINQLINRLETWKSKNPNSLLCTENFDTDVGDYFEDLNYIEQDILKFYDDFNGYNDENADSFKVVNDKLLCYELKRKIYNYFNNDERTVDSFELSSEGDYIRVDVIISHWYGVHHIYLFDSTTKLFRPVKVISWCVRGRGGSSVEDYNGGWITLDEVFKQIVDYPD
ncbi:Hypothetical protein HVR_LOCUS442 [uncultured virus]|nr:Hypothetical protein HVR_LOCUS442 [uncultured virus]